MKMTSKAVPISLGQRGYEMMTTGDYEERAKGVIKCFLVMNKGKWFSAREISSFIQSHKDLRLGKFGQGLNPLKVGKLLKKHYFHDLETKKMNDNRKLYRYNGGYQKWQ